MRYTFSILAVFSTLLVGCAYETAEETVTAPAAGHDDHAAHGDAEPAAAEGFALTGENTQVLFTGTKKSGDSQSGGFKVLSGNIPMAEGKITGINVVIETDSLFSSDERLTGHLKNEDFFSAPEFPELKFESTKVEGDGDVTVTGTLTMHGQTGEVSFPAKFRVADGKVTLNSEFKVDRTKFGMNFTGKPDDPINADVDIKIIVGGE
jgi:polyisoprenoid-binding protein YceI